MMYEKVDSFLSPTRWISCNVNCKEMIQFLTSRFLLPGWATKLTILPFQVTILISPSNWVEDCNKGGRVVAPYMVVSPLE